jgi:hypothetical protein
MIEEHIVDGRLNIRVKPNCRKTAVMGWDEEHKALRVDVDAPPEDNKANIEVLKFFSRLSKKKVRIVTGLKSKEKVLEFL